MHGSKSAWRTRTAAVVIGVSLVLVSACGSNAKTSSVGTAAAAKPAHLTYVGFFAQQNLTVDLPVAGQSASACQVLAKAADVAQCSLNDMIQAHESGGAHLIAVMNEAVTALQYGAMAKSNISSWNDLKGKTVIVGGPKDNTVYYFHTMGRAHGLKDTDYNFQYAGASSARLAALKSGAVDLALLANPADIQAEQDGFRRLDNLLPTYLNGDNYAGGGPVVSQEWAKAHGDERSCYLVAVLKATAWIYDPANKQALFEIVGPKLNLTQEIFNQTYQVNVVDSKTWSSDGQIKDSAIQGVLRGLVDLGSLKEPLPPASKYDDTSYLAAALKSLGR